ncbi:adipokinetic hormone/corazonin-related peptide-like [Toxorhynchites rutilus septentrionalis]|uniref:adipokinetic hormone/corazonin-related peptide-like n=1 Tax=Toxorhynchites rutilus septentrionalis TaxID=329112 RepID=UPI002479DC1B|nr:adipokinetic hormone/corazonin-related peptide-like [Toxorhynchites rutilus septentrionalis]
MFCNRRQQLEKLVLFVLFSAVLTSTMSNAQVTFSRDWNAGKRSLVETSQPASECSAILRSISNLCTAITKNIQHLTVCETRSLIKTMQYDDVLGESSNGNSLPLFANNHL